LKIYYIFFVRLVDWNLLELNFLIHSSI